MVPADLSAAGDHVVAALSRAAPSDWSAAVPKLDWDVRTTVEHLVDVVAFYTLHALPASRERLRVDVVTHPGLSNLEVVNILATEVRGLATAAEHLDPDARAFHFHGLTDISGFVAMASCELLVHGCECLRGLGVELAPRPDLAAKALHRLFPSAPTDRDPWATLLWATGRESLEGHPDVEPDWTYEVTSPHLG